MIKSDEIEFKKLDFQGLKTLVYWAEKEGWNPGPYDAKAYWAADPNGYYGCFLKEKLIGGGSIVSYDGNFGFMGFFIIDPEYRSKGLGRELWYQRRDLLLSRLKPGASIGMDGVLAMQDFYAKGGFKIAFRDERHEKLGEVFNIHNSISNITKEDYNDVIEYDKKYFGFQRSKFLIPWLELPGSISIKFVENEKIKGISILRKANHGYKICPLFADNEVIAEELYKACLNSAIDEPVYIDIPMINESAVKLKRKYKTTYVFECARMYYGSPPEINMNNVYGITTFELG